MDVPTFMHLANAVSYDKDGFFGQDALFDDHGADAGGDIYSLLSGFEGDAVAPGEETGVGDIRSVRVRPVPGEHRSVWVDVTMNSLHVTTVGPAHPGRQGQERLHPVAFIGVDEGPGGFSAWPHGAGLLTPGLDRGFTVTFDGFATEVRGGEPTPVDVRLVGNTMSVLIEDLPAEAQFVVGAGEWDPVARSWRTQPGGGTPVLDLALSCAPDLRPDITSPAVDDAACEWRQSADLAAAETTRSWFPVDIENLGSRIATASPPDSGYASYVFRSRVDNGNGYWRYSGNPQVLGPWQAFTVALPEGWRQRVEDLYVFLHGAGAWGTLQAPVDTFRSDVADSGRVVLYPYGRGPAPWWFPAAEADVLETVAAAELLFGTDPDKRVLSGISHGGYGTYLLGWAHPDLWAGLVVAMAANDTRYAVALTRPDLPHQDTAALVDNGRNAPVLMLAGTEQTQHEMQQRRQALLAAGVEHTMLQFAEPLHGAKFMPDTSADVVRWLDSLPARQLRPRHIDYTYTPDLFEEIANDPHRDGKGTVQRGHAWWIRDVLARDGRRARITALDERTAWDAQRVTEEYGPEPAPRIGVPTAISVSGLRVEHGGTASGSDVHLTLEGVSSLRLDLRLLGLSRGDVIHVESDGATDVHATGGRICGHDPCLIPQGRSTLRVR